MNTEPMPETDLEPNKTLKTKWSRITAAALKLEEKDVALQLLAGGVNNSVYKVNITEEVLNQEDPLLDPLANSAINHSVPRATSFVLRVPAPGKSLMSYGAIGSNHIKSRFQQFAISGHCPRPLELDLPEGAILCDYVPGRIAKFPEDMSLITHSLAKLHTSGMTQNDSLHSPQASEHNSISYKTMAKVVNERIKMLDAIGLDATSCQIIRQLVDECLDAPIDKITAYEQNPTTPIFPILKDANPSNFIIKDGDANSQQQAIVVDIEGDFYGMPIIDVGHSSLFSACLWAYEDISPLPASDLVKLYEEYYEHLATLYGNKFAIRARVPRDIIISVRYATLSRCLGWMIMLIYLAEHQGIATPKDKLDRAKIILSQENLLLAQKSEMEIAKLI